MDRFNVLSVYSSQERAESPTMHTDVEVFEIRPRNHKGDLEPGWYFWFCLPGCLPDSEPYGPFPGKEEAIQEARATVCD